MAYIKEILHELIVNDVILITIWKESICPFYIKFMIYRSCLIRVFIVQIFILCLKMFERSQFLSSRIHLDIQFVRESVLRQWEEIEYDTLLLSGQGIPQVGDVTKFVIDRVQHHKHAEDGRVIVPLTHKPVLVRQLFS